MKPTIPGYHWMTHPTGETVIVRLHNGRLRYWNGCDISARRAQKCVFEPVHPANPWQTERPTAGKWWVSVAPDKRTSPSGKVTFPAVVACKVFSDGVEMIVQYRPGGDYIPLSQEWFTGALWQRGDEPADPFAEGGIG